MVRASAPSAGLGSAPPDRRRCGQHAVDRQQHPSGDHPRPDGTLHHGALLLHPPGADVHRNDNAEGQGGDGVHGLIALDEALDHRMGRVVPGGRTVALQRVDQTAHKGDDNQRHQDGAENLAQPVVSFSGRSAMNRAAAKNTRE